MREIGIAQDDLVEIGHFSRQTVLALAIRLQQSQEFQALISREIELDELWRRIDTALKSANEQAALRGTMESLRTLFQAVQEAHDLAGAGQPDAAAAVLHAALVSAAPTT